MTEIKRVTRPGGMVVLRSSVSWPVASVRPGDNTASVINAGIGEMRSTRAGRQQFWPNGQAALWRKMGLSCSPFQAAGTENLCLFVSSCSAWPPLGKAGGTIMKRRLIML